MRNLQARQHGAHALDRAKCGEKRLTYPCRQFGGKPLRDQLSFVMFQHGSRVPPKKQIKRLIQTKRDTVSRQNFREAATAQHLAIDQHAVAVKNDEIGLRHRVFPYPRSEHTLIIWATTQ
jgi:hypothetical protein